MKLLLGRAVLLPIAVLAATGCGGEEPPGADLRAPSVPSVTPPSVAPAGPLMTGPDDLVEMLTPHEVAWLRPGLRGTASDGTGSTARLVARAGGHVLEVRDGARVLTAALPDDADAPFLLDVQLGLGQAGPGWVVGREGGDSTRLWVYVEGLGHLERAAPVAGDPDLGSGFTEEGRPRMTSFNSVDQPYTRVATGQPRQYLLYGWEVTGPGEGGGQDDLRPRLRAVEHGAVCLDEAAQPMTVVRC